MFCMLPMMIFLNSVCFSEQLLSDSEQETNVPSWKLSFPHVLVATIVSFLYGYHLGFVFEITFSIKSLFLSSISGYFAHLLTTICSFSTEL